MKQFVLLSVCSLTVRIFISVHERIGIIIPFMHTMALLEKELEIKKSILPAAGKGLFTKTAIPKGTRIVEYKGRSTTWKEVKYDYKNGYIYTIDAEHVIDAKTYKKALGRYANDARGFTTLRGITNNSRYVVDGLKVFIEATKDIPAGSEIFVSYGKEYWQVMQKNKEE
jgi:SET domain-containing protein